MIQSALSPAHAVTCCLPALRRRYSPREFAGGTRSRGRREPRDGFPRTLVGRASADLSPEERARGKSGAGGRHSRSRRKSPMAGSSSRPRKWGVTGAFGGAQSRRRAPPSWPASRPGHRTVRHRQSGQVSKKPHPTCWNREFLAKPYPRPSAQVSRDGAQHEPQAEAGLLVGLAHAVGLLAHPNRRSSRRGAPSGQALSATGTAAPST